MSNENTGNLLANPLPIVMVVLLAAGVLIKQVPLQSARPSDPERVKFVPAAQQDVEARLWQDPFAAVEKQEGRSGPKTHTPKALRDLIQKKSTAGGQVKIIAVSVFGGSYSEAAESRRRTRFAVLAALGFHGYSPANPDAIGYFRIKLPGAARMSRRFPPAALVSTSTWSDRRGQGCWQSSSGQIRARLRGSDCALRVVRAAINFVR